ncbi:flocculation protein FLO11 isoform X6 [Chelmon rostratus]|uniref:flocculation protein FLO11 isoform X6 n=1 Tax=Chelmon rostratus TaxID=109905 RepID=UPI001BE5F285|nr:flocculation protein FLO11 isoform X6 [Chelmon rostratus]
MFLSFVSVVFVLSAAVRGTTTATGTSTESPNARAVSDTTITPTSGSSSSITTSALTPPPSSTTEHFTASGSSSTPEKGTTESTTMKPSTSTAEMTSSQSSTESRTAAGADSSTITATSKFTTSSPTGSPSAPTSGTTPPPASSPSTSTTITHTSNSPTSATPKTSTTQTVSTNTSPETTPSSSTITTDGPTPSSPTAISTTSSLPTSTSPGSSTTLDTTTLSPSTTTSGVTTNLTMSTKPPADTTTVSSTTASTAFITIPVLVCPAVPCPPDSICSDGTCQCRTGTVMENGVCTPAQVFAGELHLIALTFEPEMNNRSSKIFQETALNISKALFEALKDVPGYQRSEVLRLEEGSVRATVNNIFENTNATEDSIKESIEKAINDSADSGGLLAGAAFTGENLCDQAPFPCEIYSTTCENRNGRAICFCKDGYIASLYSNTTCIGCPSGQQPDGDTCKPCSFGYAGFNCNDSSLLAVVVISSVLGGLLLILVLAVLGYFCWRRFSKRKPDLSSSPYSSSESWPAGIVSIPRATTSWNSDRPVEMVEGANANIAGNRTYQNGAGFHRKQRGWKKTGSYELNPDGMRTFKGKNPSRYSYLVQGHENPYFLPGDDRIN